MAALALPVLWLAQHAWFGPSGYRALLQKRQEVQQQLTRIQALEAQNRDLNQAVRALRSDPNAIEAIAREQLHLARPGEVVYTYPATTAPGTAGGTAAAALSH